MAEGFTEIPERLEQSEQDLSTVALRTSPESFEVTDVLTSCTQKMQTTKISENDECTIQEQSSDSSLDITPYYDFMPEDLKVNYHDGVIIYDEDDRELAVSLQQRLISIRCGDRFPDIVLSHDTISIAQPFFLDLNNLIKRSTYIFILVTHNFTDNRLMVFVHNTLLMNSETYGRVIPVWTEKDNRGRPFGLNILKGLDFHKVQFEDDTIRKLIKNRGHEILTLRKELEKRQRDWINDNKDQCKTDSKSIEAYKALDDVSSEFDYKQWLSQFACEDMVECELFGQSEGKVAVNKGIQPVWENKKITLAAERVCYIHTPGSLGTGFRAGSKYIFTAAHIVRNLSSGSEDEFKKHDYYAVFDYLREQQLKKAPKFYFQAIVYKNQDLDTAVIELEETEETVLPPKFPKFDDIGKVMKKVKNDHTDIGVFLVGHNGALPMQLDVVKKYFRLGKRFKRAYNSLNAKCKESIDKDKKLRNLFDGRRCLFNCNFRHGGSGSPGVYYGESDTPVVVTFLQQGYPWWYYGEGCSKDKKNWKEDDCIQQGINFNAVYNDMKTENPDLCKDIFDQSFISFETE